VGERVSVEAGCRVLLEGTHHKSRRRFFLLLNLGLVLIVLVVLVAG
jgi:hypothetical protein